MSHEMMKNTDVTLSQAMIKVKALEQQVQQEGNVDSEVVMFEEILQKLSNQQISPQEAISQAEFIVSRRQNYH